MKKKLICCILLITLLFTGCDLTSILELTTEYIEVTVEDSVFENRFYFEQYTEEEQLVYKEIYQGLIEGREEITVHSADGEAVNSILSIILMDFPQIFWTDGSGESTTYYETYTVLKPTYIYVGEDKERRESEIENETAQILSHVPTEASEYEKIKYIYEYLVNTVTYVEDAPDNQNIYSAIVGKQSVCAGYAKANQYLLEQLGIFCIYVIGMATNQEGTDSHAWNIVKCNDEYYYIDTTWADWIWLDEENKETEELLYDYLCCDEQVLAQTHKADENYIYPECISTDLNYYRLNQTYYETAEKAPLLDGAYRTIDARGDITMYKFPNPEIYMKAKEVLINEVLDEALQYQCEKYGLEEAQCMYEEQDDLNRFLIYWEYE